MAGKHDPWVQGVPIPGVRLPYNSRAELLGGEHGGETGWLVGLELRDNDPIYTVELEGGGPDAEVPQSKLQLLDGSDEVLD